jgi:cellobiose-specific phosphotransferase system component IIB
MCVWIEILGLSPQVWCSQNIEQVVSNKGKVEWIDSKTDYCVMVSAKILIQTELMHFIGF